MALLLLAFAAGGGAAALLSSRPPSSTAGRAAAWLKRHLGHAREGDLLIHLVVVSAIGCVVMSYRLAGFRIIKQSLSDVPDPARDTLHFDDYGASSREKVAL
jgi:hypothetical protein